ncbi:hypothetical protein NDU88_003783 [Pleurodeles waltl]|uniref:Uncharacterized protein n=1 Tax=Pleurodeles waltl TaxID=8319 RepID=A0AAV7SGX6_PLEWA|nr:hypothetical protein NDU88_003783 [Pleurodeles waltl]
MSLASPDVCTFSLGVGLALQPWVREFAEALGPPSFPTSLSRPAASAESQCAHDLGAAAPILIWPPLTGGSGSSGDVSTRTCGNKKKRGPTTGMFQSLGQGQLKSGTLLPINKDFIWDDYDEERKPLKKEHKARFVDWGGFF